jgi:DNA adenine methylase
MYHGYRNVTYKISYSAQDRYKGAEIMFFSNGLKIPTVTSPANLDKKYINKSLFPLA